MNEFLISDAASRGGLLFYDRSPLDHTEPIDGFSVRVTGHELAAACQLYCGYTDSHPARLFADMARQWSGWADELIWESFEGELALRCRHDRLGHITIRVEIRSGPMPDDWQLVTAIMAEAGQLDDIARRADLFFGRTS